MGLGGKIMAGIALVVVTMVVKTNKQSTTISAIFEHTAIICEAVEDVGFISSVK
jgi:hypothetical protein